MRDTFGYICLALFVFATVAAAFAAARPDLFRRRRASAARPPTVSPGAGPAVSVASAAATPFAETPSNDPQVPAAGPAPGGGVTPAELIAPADVIAPAEVMAPAAVPAPAFAGAPEQPTITAPPPAPATPARRSIPLIAALSGVAVVCAALTYVLLLMPVYSVEVVPPEQVVAAPGSRVPVEVTNGGALGGTFETEPTLDGTTIASVSGDVSAGDSSLVDVVLPDDLSAGAHTLAVAGVEYRFTALTPPDYRVGKLKVEPAVVKPKQEVTVTVTVKNRGEATGEYPGTLEAAGTEVGAAETEIAGGDAEIVRVRFEPEKLGKVKLAVGDSKASLMVVKPVRPANGTVLRNTLSGGPGKVVFKTGYPEDAMFCLTTSKKAKKAALVVYVRGKKSTTISGLRDGSYWVYYSTGKDWNHYSHDFLTVPYHGRFDKPANFRTSSWTTSYIDWSAWTKWTTQHTQYTIFTIELSPKAETKEWTPPVPANKFPKL